MPKLARQPRHRRSEDASRIETAAWVQAMPRRIEASVSVIVFVVLSFGITYTVLR